MCKCLKNIVYIGPRVLIMLRCVKTRAAPKPAPLLRGAGFGAALVLAHLGQYHRLQDNTKLFFKFVLHTIIE